MTNASLETQKWLDERYKQGIDTGKYKAHQPIYGPSTGETDSPNFVKRYIRTFSLLRHMTALEFDDVLDVGASEGYHVALIEKIFNVPTFGSDFSAEACRRSKEIFGTKSLAADAAVLPFADNAFDLVICNETIEHVLHTAEVLLELYRVARRYVIISTAEAFPVRSLALINTSLHPPQSPHADQAYFHASDFQRLFEPNAVACYNQFLMYSSRSKVRKLIKYKGRDRQKIKSIIRSFTRNTAIVPGARGIVVIIAKTGGLPNRTISAAQEDAILDGIIDHQVPLDYSENTDETADETLLKTIKCPACQADLTNNISDLQCRQCNLHFPIQGGVPEMFMPMGKGGYDNLIRERSEATAAASVHTDRERLLQARARFDIKNKRYSKARLLCLKAYAKLIQTALSAQKAIMFNRSD